MMKTKIKSLNPDTCNKLKVPKCFAVMLVIWQKNIGRTGVHCLGGSHPEALKKLVILD